MKTSKLTGADRTEYRTFMQARRRQQRERVATHTALKPSRTYDNPALKRINRLIGLRGRADGAPFGYSHMRHLTPKRQSVRERLRARTT